MIFCLIFFNFLVNRWAITARESSQSECNRDQLLSSKRCKWLSSSGDFQGTIFAHSSTVSLCVATSQSERPKVDSAFFRAEYCLNSSRIVRLTSQRYSSSPARTTSRHFSDVFRWTCNLKLVSDLNLWTALVSLEGHWLHLPMTSAFPHFKMLI